MSQGHVVLGLLLNELVRLGRLSQSGAEIIGLLTIPEACWGPNPPDLRTAIREAVAPRRFKKESA